MLSSIREKKDTSTQPVSRCRSNTLVGKEFNDSRESVRRYIRLTYLIKELLDFVDNSLTKDSRYNLTIGFTTGVELSYLSKDEQRLLYNAIVYLDCTPSYAQGRKLRELSNKKKLSYDSISIFGYSSSISFIIFFITMHPLHHIALNFNIFYHIR